MIRFADEKDIPQLKGIWHISFGDSEEYIDMFMEQQIKNSQTVVYEEDNKIFSMFFLFRCDFSINGKTHPAFYLYAAATLPQYRGKGIMGKMLEFSKSYAAENGFDFIILSPAERSLYDYYGRFGFKACFKSQKITLTLVNENEYEVNFSQNDFEKMLILRNAEVKKADGVLWDEEFFRYAVYENGYTKGNTKSSEECYGIYFKEDDHIIFKELIGENAKKAIDFALSICKEENVKGAQIVVPVCHECAEISENDILINTGMAVPLNSEAEKALENSDTNAYLGLTLG